MLKGADRFSQILEADPVGSRRHADSFARHGGDLPAFGFIVLCDPHSVGKFRRRLSRDLRHVVRHLGECGLAAEQFGYTLEEVGCRAGLGGNGQWRRNLSRAKPCVELADLAGKR